EIVLNESGYLDWLTRYYGWRKASFSHGFHRRRGKVRRSLTDVCHSRHVPLFIDFHEHRNRPGCAGTEDTHRIFRSRHTKSFGVQNSEGRRWIAWSKLLLNCFEFFAGIQILGLES